jgi:hypothetical protein
MMRQGLASSSKVITSTLILLFLIEEFFVPSMVDGQITSSFSNNSNINPTAFTLTIYSPNTQNQTFSNVIPLKFSINWTEYPTFTFPIPPAPKLNGIYAYTVDNNPAVTITSNQSSSDVFGYSNFTVNPTFSYSVNVSNLTNGYHTIIISASLYGSGYFFFGASSSPVQFMVENPTAPSTQTATISQLLTLAIVLTVVITVTAIVLLYDRYRKIINVKKETSGQCSKSGTSCSKSRTKSHLLTFINW